MFYSISEEELRSICRVNIEAFEKWARTVIDSELTKQLGENYFDMELAPGIPVVKKSIRDICYTNDFIDGVKQYFYDKGEERVFNTPNAIKLNDSLGNEFQLNKDKSFELISINRVGTDLLHQFRLGERYSAWLTLDPSFSPDQYIFDWNIECGRHLGNSSRLDIQITEDMIRERCPIYCTIKSNKSWHRYRGYDQQFAIVFQVLPPDE